MAEFSVRDETTDSKGYHLQTTVYGEFFIKQLRSPRAGTDAEFLPVQVNFQEKEVWSFNYHKRLGFRGLALLREVDDELVIILATKTALFDVLPVQDLPHLKLIGEQMVGGRKLKDIIVMKSLIAEIEGLDPVWSVREAAMQQVLTEKARLQQQTEKAAAEAAAAQEREERLARRDAKRAEIAGRPRIIGYTLSGDRRHGQPVVGDEWMSLGNSAFCISVTSYNSQTGEVGELIESFKVKKDGAKKVRQSVAVVTEQQKQQKAISLAQTLSFQTVPVKGELEEVIVVASIEDVRALRDQGLNSGALVMCPKSGDETRYSVFSLTEGKISVVTELMKK